MCRTNCGKTIRSQLPGFDVSRLFLNATHTHSAPPTDPNIENDVEKGKGMTAAEFRALFLKRAAEAVIEAWNGRRQGGISWGLGQAVVGHCGEFSIRTEEQRCTGNRQRGFYRSGRSSDSGVEMLFCWDMKEKTHRYCPQCRVPFAGNRGNSISLVRLLERGTETTQGEVFKGFIRADQCGTAGDQSPRDLVRNYRGEPDMWDVPGIVEIGNRIAHAVDTVYPSAKKTIKTKVAFGHMVQEIKLPARRYSEEEYRKASAVVEEIMSREPKDPNSPETAWNRF